MDTRQLEYILAIAEEKNLSRAADKLFITQSALSQQLAKLKREGLPPLFVQSKREMQLTDAGKIYVNGARTILKLEQDARKDLQNLSANRIRPFHVSVAPQLHFLFCVQVLPKLRMQFPNADIRTQPLRSGTARQMLETGKTDLAFFPTQNPSGEMFRHTPLCEEELGIALLSRLSGTLLPYVLPEPGTHLRSICDHAFAVNQIQPDIYAETNDFNIALQLTRMGECAAVLPRRIVMDSDLELNSFPRPCCYSVTAVCRKNTHFPMVDATIRIMGELF